MDGQTDGRTNGQICYINYARQYADAIKSKSKVRGFVQDIIAKRL